MSVASERLEDVAQVVRGVSFDKAEVSAGPIEGMVPILRAGNISDVLDTDSDLIWVPSARVKPEQRLRSGDIAICMSSGSQSVVGKSAPLRREWTGSVGAFCAIVRPRPDRIEPSYLALYMRSEGFRAWTRKSEGANIKNIRQSELLQHSVPLPSLTEQRRIVDLLSRAENIVRMRREAEAKAKEIIPALFLDMFGDPARNEREWETVPLHALISETKLGLVRGSSELSDGYRLPYLRMDSISDGSIVSRPLKRTEASQAEEKEYALAIGDLLFNTRNSRELVGKTGLIRHLPEPVTLFNNNLMRVRFDGRRTYPEFITAQFQTRFVQNQLESIKRGTTSVFAIYFKDLRAVQIRLPPLELQREFSRHSERLHEFLKAQQQSTELAVRAFMSLLAQMFAEAG